MPKWIEFDLFKAGERTSIWLVRSKENGFTLGFVKWYGPWRKYAYFPNSDTVYEETCNRDIADFIENETKKHRERLKNAKNRAPKTL